MRWDRTEFLPQNVPCGFFDHLRRHRIQLLYICVNERMLAEKIYYARDPARIKMYRFHRLGREDWVSLCASDAQPLRDIAMGLLKGEWRRDTPESNALPELPQLRAFELIFELRLAHKHDLQ